MARTVKYTCDVKSCECDVTWEFVTHARHENTIYTIGFLHSCHAHSDIVLTEAMAQRTTNLERFRKNEWEGRNKPNKTQPAFYDITVRLHDPKEK